MKKNAMRYILGNLNYLVNTFELKCKISSHNNPKTIRFRVLLCKDIPVYYMDIRTLRFKDGLGLSFIFQLILLSITQKCVLDVYITPKCVIIRVRKGTGEENKMKLKQLLNKLKEVEYQIEESEIEYDAVGIRYEDKQREIGEVLPPSKYNDDREDEREFPRYDNDGYEELPEAAGSCAWYIDKAIEDVESLIRRRGEDAPANMSFLSDHCYIIVGDRVGFNIDHVLDDGEIVIEDAEVLEQLF